MKKLSAIPVTTQVEKLSHDGRGIARVNGKTTFIEGALPNETVTFAYTRQKRDFDEGRLLTVIEPSPQRIQPKCPHYEQCGGCSLQHLDSEAQIYVKQDLLLDAFKRVGHCEPESMLPPITANPWHYRHKARLSVRYVEKKSATLIGFREKHNPRYITDIASCAVLHERVAREIITMRHLLDSFDNPRHIAQIEVAAGDDVVALIFRNLEPLSEADQEKLKSFAIQTGFRIYLQPAGPDSITLFYPTNEVEHEYLTYRLPEFGLTYEFYPTDFTQVNARINPLMIKQALALLTLDRQDVVLDLFCGLGNFSLPIAKSCEQVIAIEGSEGMVKRGERNARLNQLTNLTFLCANLEDEHSLNDAKFKDATKLLLDPPRTGALAIVKQINSLNLERIVYVSCHPITLARDADILVNQHGYRLVSLGVMDMFPHTSHVESIALFVRK